MEVQKYIVTGKNFPEWLNNGVRNGVIKVYSDEEGEFSHILVEAPTGRKIAKKNDVIVKTKSGFSVLTKEQANKYKVSFVPNKGGKNNEVEE